MMGIRFYNPCYVYIDNQSVFYNTTLPESTLKKKSNSIAYHIVREGVATGEWLTGYEPSDTTMSDQLTKPLLVGQGELVLSEEFYIIFDWHCCGFSSFKGFPHNSYSDFTLIFELLQSTLSCGQATIR